MRLTFNTLVVIVASLVILTRFTNLGSNPPHLSNDEISIAYDAYSVLKTLRDEHNHFLPLSFQSHNTYKAPLTIYLTIPSIAIFGNTNAAARIPTAILGSLTILVLGLLVFELTNNKYLSLLSSFILSISPIHILASRMAFESTNALFFFVAALYLFFLSLRTKFGLFIIVSSILFALSIYSYHTEWVFTPFTLAVLFLLYHKSILKKKTYYIGIILFFILITPLFVDFLNNLQNSTRATTDNILKDPVIANKIEDPNTPFWHKASFTTQAILEKYSAYYNLSYLFLTGSNLLSKDDPFQAGLFLSPFLPFFLFGIFKIKALFKEKSNIIYILLITSPITASLTLGAQSNSRNLISTVPISIACAVGIFVFWRSVKSIWKLIYTAILIIAFMYFFAIFYYHFPKSNAEGFQYGYEQIALFIKPRYQDFKKIIIDPRFGPGNMYSGVPHLYIPFFTYLNPIELQQRKLLRHGSSFDKYEIREYYWNEEIEKDTLIVVPISNPPNEFFKLRFLYEVALPDSKPAFYIYSL